MSEMDNIWQDTWPCVPVACWHDWMSVIKKQYPALRVVSEMFDADHAMIRFSSDHTPPMTASVPTSIASSTFRCSIQLAKHPSAACAVCRSCATTATSRFPVAVAQTTAGIFPVAGPAIPKLRSQLAVSHLSHKTCGRT